MNTAEKLRLVREGCRIADMRGDCRRAADCWRKVYDGLGEEKKFIADCYFENMSLFSISEKKYIDKSTVSRIIAGIYKEFLYEAVTSGCRKEAEKIMRLAQKPFTKRF